ncbi:hypothetical protein NDU88_005574 [Pleurodeles waltl]|uniref:Uncharacterized protein n=1 Tax=Pleurodeles waltl TaxID=8319 RepID=A0AAV7PG43_PLEWA|nr:hypothetical protein NDU88_005574 [Pleurodeles waltl]
MQATTQEQESDNSDDQEEEEEENDLATEPKPEEMPTELRSPAKSVARSHVSSASLSQSDLEDRRVEKDLKLQLAKLKLTAEENKTAIK